MHFVRQFRGLGLGSGLGAVPAPPPAWAWTAFSSGGSAYQTALNEELTRLGYAKISVDGKLGPGTCGATELLEQEGVAVVPPSACYPSNGIQGPDGRKRMWTTASAGKSYPLPVRVGPPPIDPNVPDDRVLKFQKLANANFAKLKIQGIAESGLVDKQTCTAVIFFTERLQKKEPVDEALSAHLIANLAAFVEAVKLVPRPCAMLVAVEGEKPAPPPPKPAPKADPCDIQPNTASAVAALYQKDINSILRAEGYKPVPLTGKLDAATCAAANFIAKKGWDKLGYPPPGKGKTCPSGPIVRCSATKPAPTTTSAETPEGICWSRLGHKKKSVSAVQTDINYVLKSKGYKPIPVTGESDEKTLAALQYLGREYPDLATRVGGDFKECTPGTIRVFYPKQYAFTPVKAPAPAPKKVDPCAIAYGAKTANVKLLQKRINEILASKKYQPIKVTGVLDKPTCGARVFIRDMWPKLAVGFTGCKEVATTGCSQWATANVPKPVPAKKAPAAPPPPPPPPAPPAPVMEAKATSKWPWVVAGGAVLAAAILAMSNKEPTAAGAAK